MTANNDRERFAKGEEAHELVGVPHGHVEINGEKVVYDYDDEGKFVGWHKEEVSE